MSSCEKCWNDASLRAREGLYPSQAEAYQVILKERKNNPCSPKEQAGQWWDEEKQYDRRTLK